MRVISTLLSPDEGAVRVAGRDVVEDPDAVRRSIGLSGPYAAVDEYLTGFENLDMVGRLRDLVKSGTTLLLTTQYLEEADMLADEIVVIDAGQAIARGTADQLKARTGGERIEVMLASADDRAVAMQILDTVAVAEITVSDSGRQVVAAVNSGASSLRTVLDELLAREIAVYDIGLRRPTPEDVFWL